MPAYQLEPCDANCSCKKRNKIKIKKLIKRDMFTKTSNSFQLTKKEAK